MHFSFWLIPKKRCLKFRISLFSLSEAATKKFPLRVMNGVKRSETRIRSLSAAAHACHLPPLEMRYKSPLRNKFMNTLAAFRAALSSSSVRSFLSLLAQAAPILSYLPILLGTFGKFLNRPNHGVQRSIGRRSGGRSDQPHILGRSPIGSPLSLSLSLSLLPS